MRMHTHLCTPPSTTDHTHRHALTQSRPHSTVHAHHTAATHHTTTTPSTTVGSVHATTTAATGNTTATQPRPVSSPGQCRAAPCAAPPVSTAGHATTACGAGHKHRGVTGSDQRFRILAQHLWVPPTPVCWHISTCHPPSTSVMFSVSAGHDNDHTMWPSVQRRHSASSAHTRTETRQKRPLTIDPGSRSGGGGGIGPTTPVGPRYSLSTGVAH